MHSSRHWRTGRAGMDASTGVKKDEVRRQCVSACVGEGEHATGNIQHATFKKFRREAER